jgi:hypothetical protein
MPDVRAEFEETISLLTQPLNGQYPRPWMTNLTNPQEVDVFIVGKNQRNGYDCARLGSHDRHLNALFNRNSETCRKVYNEMTAGKASPTRKNTDRFVKILASKGVHNILGTNVICYSTPMSADLRLGQHSGGGETWRRDLSISTDSYQSESADCSRQRFSNKARIRTL